MNNFWEMIVAFIMELEVVTNENLGHVVEVSLSL